MDTGIFHADYKMGKSSLNFNYDLFYKTEMSLESGAKPPNHLYTIMTKTCINLRCKKTSLGIISATVQLSHQLSFLSKAHLKIIQMPTSKRNKNYVQLNYKTISLMQKNQFFRQGEICANAYLARNNHYSVFLIFLRRP